jgi:sec-independent protein translocase protein TatA
MFGTIEFPPLVVGNLFSPQDILVIAVIFLLFFGGKKIPEMAKGLGEGIRNFKNAVKTESDDAETKKQG